MPKATTTNGIQPGEITQNILHIPIQFYHTIIENEEKILFYIQIIMGIMGLFSLVLVFQIVCIVCTRRNEYAQRKKSVNQDISLHEKIVENQINGDETNEKTIINDLYVLC